MNHDALVDALSCTVGREDGATVYRNPEGKVHRVGGPAVIYPSGTRYWFQNGVLHRLDGPAVEYATGAKEWLVRGVMHRIDGPAVVRANGSEVWYINGRRLSKTEFDAVIKSGAYREP